MKIFDIDWPRFVQNLAVWEDLELSTRSRFKELKSSQIIRRDQISEADFDRLVGVGVLETKVDDLNAVLRPGAGSEFARVIRALSRHDLLASPFRPTFVSYLHEHFTVEQKAAFLGPRFGRYGGETQLAAKATSQRWLRDFLDLTGPAAAKGWEGDRIQTYPYAESPFLAGGVFSVAQELARNVAAAAAPLSIREALATLTKATPEAGAAALRACIRYLIVFPAMRAKDAVPVLTIWPQIHERMHRTPASPPRPEQPVERYQATLLLNDVTTLLLALAPPGLRMRADGSGLFARAEKQVIEAMVPVPAWVSLAHPGARGPNRLARAAHAAWNNRWVAPAGETGVDLTLVATPASEVWMGRPEKDRLVLLLDDRRFLYVDPEARKRPSDVQHGEPEEFSLSDLRTLFGADEAGALYDDTDDPDLDADPWDDMQPWKASDNRLGRDLKESLQHANMRWNPTLIDACTAALVEAGEGDAFVRLEEFLAYHAIEKNPLIGLDMNIIPNGWTYASDDDLEKIWADHLVRTLSNMTVLGGVELARNDQDRVLFRVNDTGRYLLRLQDDFSLEHESNDRTTRILVQPNFEITFLGRSVAMEAKLGRFCERVGTGVGVLFKITRDATFRASAAGLMPEDMIGVLSEASAQKLPKNVEREVRGWFEQCRRLRLEAVSVIRCPSAETAALVLSAGRKEVQALSDTVIEYIGKAPPAAFIRKLAQAGIFLDVSKTSGARKRKATGRRSR